MEGPGKGQSTQDNEKKTERRVEYTEVTDVEGGHEEHTPEQTVSNENKNIDNNANDHGIKRSDYLQLLSKKMNEALPEPKSEENSRDIEGLKPPEYPNEEMPAAPTPEGSSEVRGVQPNEYPDLFIPKEESPKAEQSAMPSEAPTAVSGDEIHDTQPSVYPDVKPLNIEEVAAEQPHEEPKNEEAPDENLNPMVEVVSNVDSHQPKPKKPQNKSLLSSVKGIYTDLKTEVGEEEAKQKLIQFGVNCALFVVCSFFVSPIADFINRLN